eukprot:6858387-Ditylum_brightwellii.AAC.1
MRTIPTISKQSNLDVERAVILFPRPAPRQLKRGQFHTYKLGDHTWKPDSKPDPEVLYAEEYLLQQGQYRERMGSPSTRVKR